MFYALRWTREMRKHSLAWKNREGKVGIEGRRQVEVDAIFFLGLLDRRKLFDLDLDLPCFSPLPLVISPSHTL